MRLVTTTDGVGRLEDGGVALLDLPFPDLGAVLAASALDEVAAAPVRERRHLEGVQLLAPVPRPGKVWAVGFNFPQHVQEVTGSSMERPDEPLVFVKVTSAVLPPGGTILLPAIAPDEVDFEAEVAIVIGRRASSVRAADAWSHVAGVTACNDLSARDVQFRTKNFGLAKSFDTFAPLGGSLVTVDEYDDPDDIGVRCDVDGERRQDDRTSNLLFPIPEIVEYLSRYTTLEPGDVVSTGSPAGAGIADGRYLRAGSTVEVRVEHVLPLVNRVEAS
jgi:2-keto-4-pentenoate hydratase/2-oxohepta-3-ene-1,7-dioic acid hydratase in catechol pathway